jgi:hypothetical protein
MRYGIPAAVWAIVGLSLLAGEPIATIVAASVAATVTAALLIFTRLTIAVDEDEVRGAFGWGWPRKVISLGQVASAARVRSHWYYGWGIRLIPDGWMWNVYGLDAVALELVSGRAFRFGSDDPDGLLQALGHTVHTD